MAAVSRLCLLYTPFPTAAQTAPSQFLALLCNLFITAAAAAVVAWLQGWRCSHGGVRPAAGICAKLLLHCDSSLLLLLLLLLQWSPGCEGGVARMEEFIQQQLQHFSHRKANVDRCVCSRLSPWIRVGSVSVRCIYYKVGATASAVAHCKMSGL
jgi:hypothetical protein